MKTMVDLEEKPKFVRLTPLNKNRRARNRIREHGGGIFLFHREDTPICHHGKPSVLVSCICTRHEIEPYMGWFSEEEVEWMEVL